MMRLQCAPQTESGVSQSEVERARAKNKTGEEVAANSLLSTKRAWTRAWTEAYVDVPSQTAKVQAGQWLEMVAVTMAVA